MGLMVDKDQRVATYLFSVYRDDVFTRQCLQPSKFNAVKWSYVRPGTGVERKHLAHIGRHQWSNGKPCALTSTLMRVRLSHVACSALLAQGSFMGYA